jgi:hypothetical protein
MLSSREDPIQSNPTRNILSGRFDRWPGSGGESEVITAVKTSHHLDTSVNKCEDLFTLYHV